MALRGVKLNGVKRNQAKSSSPILASVIRPLLHRLLVKAGHLDMEHLILLQIDGIANQLKNGCTPPSDLRPANFYPAGPIEPTFTGEFDDIQK